MLVYIRGTPIWRPEYSVNIWNLLWLSGRLIVSTKQTSIYISTFPNALTSKKAQNHDISIYFSKLDRSLVSRSLHYPEIQTALVSKRNANCKKI